MTTTLQVRMDSVLRKEAEAVFREIGVDSTTAVRMFFSKVVSTHSIPFDLKADKAADAAHIESLLLEAVDSPAEPFEAGWGKKIMARVEAQLKAKPKARA